jgi:hypothetical protein
VSSGVGPPSPDDAPGRSLGALLILLLLILLTPLSRQGAAASIRLAAPAFVPLAAEAASRVVDDLGAAFGALLDAEQRRGRR